MSVEKYRMTMLTIGSLRDVWAPESLPQSLESELAALLDGLWHQLSLEEQELLERRFPAHTHAFHSIVRATLEAALAHPDPTSGGPECSSYPPLLGREAPFREAPLKGPVSEANERGVVRLGPNVPSDFGGRTWTMRAQLCELCATHDPKQEGCEGYCPARDDSSPGFSWDELERHVADIEGVALHGSLLPPTEHAGDFTDEQSYRLAHLGSGLASYVRRHLLDFRPAEPHAGDDVGGKGAGA